MWQVPRTIFIVVLLLLHRCGADFDGVIIFDECHKAKNYGSEKDQASY